jgi:hypothetical protein
MNLIGWQKHQDEWVCDLMGLSWQALQLRYDQFKIKKSKITMTKL